MLRESDIFARVGGEEFAILLPVTNGEAAYNVAEKIRGVIEERDFVYDGKQLKITMSFGISELDTKIDGARSLKELLELADKRLYSSKEHGRNRITY